MLCMQYQVCLAYLIFKTFEDYLRELYGQTDRQKQANRNDKYFLTLLERVKNGFSEIIFSCIVTLEMFLKMHCFSRKNTFLITTCVQNIHINHTMFYRTYDFIDLKYFVLCLV